MANPTPTVNQINAFNVNVGTIINFNVIGGTDLIRSNRIYIYDINDNSLICSHLYASTELIHELPSSTDGSIEYASGKSSSDFVNNKQYYAQIQTYTNTTGTQGASGLSISKLFWCLPNPSLNIEDIDASISTTSCNAIAIYNSNIGSGVTVPNIVQQYQFNLYGANGTLISTSGVVNGYGTQIGASTSYRLSYNFVGLEVNKSYYITCNVVTTEGMSLSTVSNMFIVSIDTPTLGKATVINDACYGYISVVSSLSSSYSSNINKILVKRTDINDINSNWVTLYIKNVSSASDMNFIFIDFFNQYGVTYQYALVPIMVQTQGGIEVEIEGGYTLSNTVKSIFDGVFIADNTGIERLRAGVGYNDIELVQNNAVINPIGSQYPIIVMNSKLAYHTGSIFAQILPDNFFKNPNSLILNPYAYLVTSTYAKLLTENGDRLVAQLKTQEILSRTEMVEQRKILEKFLTNGSPKILKDWNGNIWLVSFINNVRCSFTNEWGMGIATFTGDWVEIGNALDGESLASVGLVNLGGD